MSRRLTVLLFSSTFALLSAGAFAAPMQGTDAEYGAGPGMTNTGPGEASGEEAGQLPGTVTPGTTTPGTTDSDDAPMGEGSDRGTLDGSEPQTGSPMGGMDEGTMDGMDRDGALGSTP